MREKRVLYARTVLDASKMIFVTLVANLMLNVERLELMSSTLIFIGIMTMGTLAWFIHPKEER